MNLKLLNTLVFLLTAIVLSACASTPANLDHAGKKINPADIHQPIPRKLKYSRYGNPKQYTVQGKTYKVLPSHIGFKQTGIASWYGNKFHGRKTSTQETYNMYAMTAAHKTLPIPCYVEVTNLENGKKVIVKVNDRGPFHQGRIIDLSYAAAAKLGYLGKGTAKVRIRAINAKSEAPLLAKYNKNTLKEIENKLLKGQYYYVQVGAYSKNETLDAMMTRLAGARIAPVNTTPGFGGKLRKVRVGPLKDMKIVKEVMNRLDDAGIYPVKLVTE